MTKILPVFVTFAVLIIFPVFIFNRNTITFFNRPIRSKDEFRILILKG